MKCSICGRKLSNPQSKELGYGPVCYKRKFGIALHISKKSEPSFVDVELDYNLPGQISIDEYLQSISEE